MEKEQLKGVIEALIFASETPLGLAQIIEATGRMPRKEIEDAINELSKSYATSDRGLRLEEVAGGYRIYTRPEYSQWIRRLIRTRQERRFSGPALETMAIVAYRQPITKAEIEALRGVNSDGVLDTLLERGLVRIRGRREGLGRPILYGTTQRFLEYFGLMAMDQLPNWSENNQEQDEEKKDIEESKEENKEEPQEESTQSVKTAD